MLTLQFVPYVEVEGLSQAKKIRKILDIVKGDKIVLLEGALKSPDETELIKETMEAVNERFKGIEIASINPEGSKEQAFMSKMRHVLANTLLGGRSGLTVIGPANVVKQIKQDPTRMQLILQESGKGRRRRR